MQLFRSDESIPPLPTPMPPSDELVQRNKTKIATIEALTLETCFQEVAAEIDPKSQ